MFPALGKQIVVSWRPAWSKDSQGYYTEKPYHKTKTKQTKRPQNEKEKCKKVYMTKD